MPRVTVRLTKLEGLCLDLVAQQQESRGQVIRQALIRTFKSELALSDEQVETLRSELVVRCRPPRRKVEFDSVFSERSIQKLLEWNPPGRHRHGGRRE